MDKIRRIVGIVGIFTFLIGSYFLIQGDFRLTSIFWALSTGAGLQVFLEYALGD